MNGKELYELIQDSGVTKRDWSKRVGISERTIGFLYNETKLKPKYIKAFTDARLIKQGKDIVNIDWDNKSKQIEAKNAYYNKKLKEACKEAKIPKISFHTSRHSVADLAHSKNIGISGIKDLLGHSKIATTERYMKRFYQEETDEAMDKIFGK